MVMDDVWSVPGNIHHRRQFGEIAGPRKVVQQPWSMAKRLAEAVIRSVPFFLAAMIPWISTYVQPPESVLRMKEVMAEWCTPSICFVFLVVGIMVATPGVLNGAQSRGLHDRGGDVYQRHVTMVQREALRMPDIFSVGESITPLSIPAPAPVPVPVRDFPAVRPPPVYLRREVSSRFESDVRGLGKSASAPLPRFEDLTPAKISATQSLDRESYFPRPREPAMSSSNSSSSYQDPVMSNGFNDRLPARRVPVSTPVSFEYAYRSIPAPASMSTSVPSVQLEVPPSPSPGLASVRSFEGPGSPVPTSNTTTTTPVIDHDLPASPAMPHGDIVAAPSPGPALAPMFVQEVPSVSSSSRLPSTRPSTSAPSTPPPPASPVVVQEVVATLASVAAVPTPADSRVEDRPGSPIPEYLADSPPATPTASPLPPPPGSPPATPMDSLPPPPPPPLRSPQPSLDATVIAPVEVNLSPIKTRKSQRSSSSRTGGSSRSSSGGFRESLGGKPPHRHPLHHAGQLMSVPSKGSSTSAAQKREGGEPSLAIKAAGPQLQKHDLAPVEAVKERPSATGFASVSGNVTEDTKLKPADDDVDQRVEAFLANFRQQMRLQRQESLLRQQRGEE